MSLDGALSFVPVFVLVLFRIAGLMIYAPLLGSARIPKRVKALLAIVLALGLTSGVTRPLYLPETAWGTAAAIAGEMLFGLAMGMVLSFTFVAAQWAGELIGQQMGLNMSEVFDPQFGAASSVVGDLYFMLTLAIFLIIGGHREMIRGFAGSFQALPLLSVGMTAGVWDLVIGMFSAATILAVRLAAPVLVTLLIVDLVLGFLGKTMPQLNVMTAGMSVKAMIGMLVIAIGLALRATPNVIVEAINQALDVARQAWSGGLAT